MLQVNLYKCALPAPCNACTLPGADATLVEGYCFAQLSMETC